VVLPVGGQLVDHVTVQADPARARKVDVEGITPDPHGQVVAGLAVPRNLFDLQAVRRAQEHGPAEQEHQGDHAVLQALQVGAGRDIHVVAELDGQGRVDLAGEAADGRTDVRQQEGP
jgi:hypothetical protein